MLQMPVSLKQGEDRDCSQVRIETSQPGQGNHRKDLGED